MTIRLADDAAPHGSIADQTAVSVASSPRTVVSRIELPMWTIAKVILTLVVLYLLSRLWALLLLLFVALLLAAALDPIVGRLERRGWPRAASVGLIVVGLLASIAILGLIVVPPLIDEGQRLAAALPDYVNQIQGLLNANPKIFSRIQDATNQGSADPAALFTNLLSFGVGLISVVTNTLILLIMTVYLLIDGERTVDWVLRYVPLRQKVKVRQVMPEISRVVSGYVVGQGITSALFGLFTFVVLKLTGVPNPVLLAVLAAIFDAVPIAGILLATLPAALLALTVSWPTAVIVVAAYVAYQQIENYVIVPRVYKNTLRISSFAVLIAVLVGGQLLGIVGVLLALPVAAAVPVIERVWRGTEMTPST